VIRVLDALRMESCMPQMGCGGSKIASHDFRAREARTPRP
jgi:hypothetical protein